MAPVRGFQEVMNGNANGAGIVLPDSQTENYAIDEIAKNGLLAQRQAVAQKQAQAQMNKDFATNQLKVSPTIQYRSEVNGLAQQWYDKGVNFRRQNFDPFNPDYNNPSQVAASQQYLNEKKHIEDLADLAKEVDTQYTGNQKAVQEGKLDGWDDYQAKLKGTTLRDLYKQGGLNALPQLYKPFDTHQLDQEVNFKPQTREVPEEVAPGVFDVVTQKYINMPQAARSVETAMHNQPAIIPYLKKKGITDPANLYTLGGHNMITDPQNPEDIGHIDEPGIYHQMATDYLTKPDLIKQLPAEVKDNILKSKNAVKLFNGGQMDMSKVGDAMFAKPYDASQDPAFKKFIAGKFDDQIKQEKTYQTDIADHLARKLPSLDLGSTSKMDATLANLNLRKQTNQQGWERLAISKQNAAREDAKWHEKLADNNTRLTWINDIQNMKPEAVKSFQSALQEVGGVIKPVKGGITVDIPEKTPAVDKYTGNTIPGQYNTHNVRYHVGKFSGRSGRITIEQLINKLPTFGKEKSLKTDPYKSEYNNITGGDDSADDL